MGRPAVDYAGKTVGELTVFSRDLSRLSGSGQPAYWLAYCSCGKPTSVSSTNLKSGNVRSCGHLRGGYRTGTPGGGSREAIIARSTKWNKEHKERRRKIVAKYYRQNPEKSVEKEGRRRARRRQQLCLCCTPAVLTPIYKIARLVGMEVDHIIPIARGGLHCERNLQLLPSHLNRSKGARMAGELP